MGCGTGAPGLGTESSIRVIRRGHAGSRVPLLGRLLLTLQELAGSGPRLSWWGLGRKLDALGRPYLDRSGRLGRLEAASLPEAFPARDWSRRFPRFAELPG